jgi:predicted TIM-barrel fold metal-dependent hydrolase
MQRIDIHTHVLSTRFVDHLEGRSDVPRTESLPSKRVIRCAPGLAVPVIEEMTDVDTKLAFMDRNGIAISVLSHAVPGPQVLGPGEAEQWAEHVNNELFEITQIAPDRLKAWGVLGWHDSEHAKAEMLRCVNQLGFCGIQLFSNIRGRPLDSPEFEPILTFAAENGIVMNMHPTVPLNRSYMDNFMLLTSLGFVMDTSLNTLRLIETGFFDRHPDFNLIVPHLGGVLPFLHGRVGGHSGTGHIQGEETGLQFPIGHYIKRLYVDSVTNDTASLRSALELYGPERVLFGSDHPFGNYEGVTSILEEYGLAKETEEAVSFNNARRLLSL